jgi:thymidine kinase
MIVVDEAQWFTGLYKFVDKCVNEMNKKVIVVALNCDFMGNSMGEMDKIFHEADDVNILHAFCKNCKDHGRKLVPAIRSHKFSGRLDQVHDVGGVEKYTPVCRKCYYQLNKKQKN